MICIWKCVQIVSGPTKHAFVPMLVHCLVFGFVILTSFYLKYLGEENGQYQNAMAGLEDSGDEKLKSFVKMFDIPYVHNVAQMLALTFYSLTAFFALRTQLTDPGILDATPGGCRKLRTSALDVYQEYLSFDEDEQKDLADNAVMQKCNLYWHSRDCKTCSDPLKYGCRMFKKPPKSSHCGLCNNCVRGFDHHCTLLNNCVGRRNLHLFGFFLLSSFLAGAVFAITSFIWFHWSIWQYTSMLILAQTEMNVKNGTQNAVEDLRENTFMSLSGFLFFVLMVLAHTWIAFKFRPCGQSVVAMRAWIIIYSFFGSATLVAHSLTTLPKLQYPVE